MTISNKDKLQIERANEGIERLSHCLADLKQLSDRLIIVLRRPNSGRDDFLSIGNDIAAVVTRHFEGEEATRFASAALITDVDTNKIKDDRDLMLAIEANIANSRDILEEAVAALWKRIDRLSGTSVPEVEPNVQTPSEPIPSIEEDPSPPKRNPLITIKPSFAGIGIDLVELWRRLRG